MSELHYFKKKIANQNLFVDEKYKDKTLYGLPLKIEYCKKCLVNNQKPTMRSEHSIKKGDKNRTVNFLNFQNF